MKKTKVNLASGNVFVSGDGWVNLDYSAVDSAVKHADLLSRLPMQNDTAELVYSSHFLEHIPLNSVPGFVAECWRVLAPGGVLRLVLPDLENLCRTYLLHRDKGEHEKANFIVLEMIDQCVRPVSGGELGRFYHSLTKETGSAGGQDLIAFVRERTGENLLARAEPSPLGRGGVGVWQRIRSRAERVWTRAVLRLLLKPFRSQNVSLAAVGERHQWLWDFEQLRTVLQAAGFDGIERRSASVSSFAGFPFVPLDLDSDGSPRKGAESMYVEARKPG